ncbi:ABC transporter permease [uncultured Campylobacter sp.]|mgnify:CR=1 FL=1|uniref:ABC transporter permease n=2 Tax=uncultured Campylobacter sp. TaxID=218934 RepID=UPI002609FDB3|nr:ABC transporter permease [uncultured Campylobacter sp.]
MNFTFLKILVKKEFAQIAKDRSALVIAFLMPLILVVIYGYAMRMDIKPVKVGFVSDLGSKIERDLLGGFLGSKYLQTRVYTDLESARRDFKAHEIESILYFDPRFAAKFQSTLGGLGGANGGINLNLSSDESSFTSGASDIQNTSGGANVRPLENDSAGASTESGINTSTGGSSASGEGSYGNGVGGNAYSFSGANANSNIATVNSSGGSMGTTANFAGANSRSNDTGGMSANSGSSAGDVSANQGSVNLIGGAGDTNTGLIGGADDLQNTSGGINASPFANGVGDAANNGGGSSSVGGSASSASGGASSSDKDGAEIFLIQNATQSQLALLSYVYVAGVIEQVLAQDYGFLNANLNAAARPVSVNYRSWFNEANESTWYLVSAEYVGILGLICLFMVAVVISREWDRGTIASLYNSNASALEIVTAKVGAYYFLALLGGAMTLVYGQVLLGIPIRGSVAMLLATLCVFVLEMTCLGMLISAICKNQFLAQEYAIVIGYLPVTLLSGMIFDLRGLPAAVNFIGHLLPPTYAVESFRICFLSGGQSATLWVNLAIQALGAVLFFSLCVLSVKRGAR